MVNLLIVALTVSFAALAYGADSRTPVPGPLALRSPAGVSSNASEATKVLHAKIYEAGSNRTRVLFTIVREEKTAGDRMTISETFSDPQGGEAMKTETILQGDRFVRYDLQQKQQGASARIEAKDGKIYFEYTDHGGKTKKDDEKFRDDFVVGASLARYVRAHWNELLGGKDIELRFGVPERRESVGFKIFKDDEKSIDGHDVIIAKLKPTSVIIAALVKPLYFYFDKKDMRLIEFKGRVLPKLKDGDRWKDLDAETVYTD